MLLPLLAALLSSAVPPVAAAPVEHASVREYRRTIRSYPFADPDPIPSFARLYPYFRFDGYTDQPVEREWTVVELENRWLRVVVMPEIGGKIWSAVEKSTGRSFLYANSVVKFRDVALRGPWTSGGIEPNYGVFGHTPNCATPVDYLTRTNPDGSASVVIGVLDLMTRTPWRLEITLPADKAYFTTSSLWHNPTPLEQPYYTWMNTGIKAAGNLQFVYPGTHYIGHEGEASPWPIDPKSGRDLSFYERNDFGPYKSYHVLGRLTDFWGAYWHDDDFGMGRFAPRDEKLGKKIWIWGLSRQGMIWEKLLTDSDGQYVEVQSGRSFNQAAEGSTLTPFKHRGFAPYATDRWTEYWFPVKGTKGLVAASPVGALNVRPAPGGIEVLFSPLQQIDDALEVLDGDRVVHRAALVAGPLETWAATIPVSVPPERLRVRLASGRLEYSADPRQGALSRPLESPRDFDWGSTYGLWLKGKELARQRSYGPAREAFEACLRSDPNYLPALTALAALRHRALDYAGALELTRHALAIDTYDPQANFQYGLAAQKLGRLDDARDGFELAAQSPELRVAAWTELARLALRASEPARARGDAERAIDLDRYDLEARQLLALGSRLSGDVASAGAALAGLLALDPLNTFARFETARVVGAAAEQAFAAGLRGERPQEVLLELAAWYRDLGRVAESARVLEIAPQTAEVLYWRARLADERGEPAAAALLAQADAASPALEFPFRAESAEVLSWAAGRSPSWRPGYYLALLHWGVGNVDEARRRLEACGERPDYAPFYAVRAEALRVADPARSRADLEHAARLDPAQWRFGRMLAERQLKDGDAAAALATASGYAARFPGSYILGMAHAKALLASGRFGEAAARLARLQVIPYEGSIEGRRLYREAHLMLAVEALRARDAARARREIAAARLWPENLGAGKPYPADVDERLEDFLAARAGEGHAGAQPPPPQAVPAKGPRSVGRLVEALALKQAGHEAEGRALLSEWSAAEPASALAGWAARAYAGDVGPLPDGAGEDARVLAALLRDAPRAGR